ncbi:MAG: hypothetical protein NTY22_00585 [Proteobacteria bacterium]|nr:hypothetical protein [Pseudomonadota bacterium]
MPKFLLRYFENHDLKFHLFMSLALGLLFRLIAAYFIYTPMALDDLNHAWQPVINFFWGAPMSLPSYRSPLLPYMLYGFLKIGYWFGFSYDPLLSIRMMNVGLAIVSLLTMVGGYYYFKNRENKLFGITLMYMLALYAAMPYAATRSFGEAVAIPFLMLGFGLCAYGEQKNKLWVFALGFLSLGISVLFRYHVGLIYVTYVLILLFRKDKKYFKTSILVGILVAGISISIALLYGRYPMQTLYEHLAVNYKYDFGACKWYNLILLMFGLTLPPFSLVFLDKIKKVFMDNLEAGICFLVFLIAHTLTSHKEERFMLPIVPLLLIFMSALWVEKKDSRLVKYTFSPAFLIINTVFLFLVVTVPSQKGLIEPLFFANKKLSPEKGILLNSNISKWAYDTHLKRSIQSIDYLLIEPVTPVYLENLFEKNPNKTQVMIISEDPKKLLMLDGYKSSYLSCENITYHTSIIDKILYSLNPKYNGRKKTTGSVFCAKSGSN